MTFLLTLPTKLTAILNWHLVEIRFNGDYFLIARTKKAGDEIGFVQGAGCRITPALHRFVGDEIKSNQK